MLRQNFYRFLAILLLIMCLLAGLSFLENGYGKKDVIYKHFLVSYLKNTTRDLSDNTEFQANKNKENIKGVKLMNKMSTDRGLGFPFTTFCPYLRQRYPSSNISTSLTVCTTTRGSRFGLPIKAASMPADSIFLVTQLWSTALAIDVSFRVY
jgi:hypothetical protein